MRMTQRDIEQGLRELGLKRGDIVLLHSSLSSLGEVEGGADAVIDAFLAVLGAEGTLVVPTFGALGAIPDALKTRASAVRSIHPYASVAALGKDAPEICRDHWKAELGHGPDTPYLRIAERGGYVCLLGVDQDRSTMLHVAEELLRLPYLKTTQEATFDTPEGTVTKSWPCFPGPHRDFIGLDRTFRASGKQRAGRIGKAVVRLMKARDAIEIMQALGAKDPAFVLCANPHCPDCVRQRADIRRDRFRRLPFQVAASALLAGRHAEDIVENCQAAGIDAVELDGLRGKPVPMLEAELVRRTVEQLRAGGCKVTALRLPASIREMEAVFALAAECGIPRVVLPLSAQSAGHARLAAAVKAAVSFCNLGLDGKSASDILVGLKAAGWDVGFTFSAAEFASSGEMPFRRSYKCKLRRYVDQLDVADALYDGTPQPLGEGNAEIKEMISILSAGGFAGTMVLAEGNRRVGTGALRDAVERFERLLVTM